MIERKRAVALDAALAAMFRTLQARGIPEHIRETLDQLDPCDHSDEANAEAELKRA
jgi:hypothetical protein